MADGRNNHPTTENADGEHHDAAIRPWAEKWLSAERLAPYLGASGGDVERALELYRWNAALGQLLMRDISHFEVALRNAYSDVIDSISEIGIFIKDKDDLFVLNLNEKLPLAFSYIRTGLTRLTLWLTACRVPGTGSCTPSVPFVASVIALGAPPTFDAVSLMASCVSPCAMANCFTYLPRYRNASCW